MNEKSKTRGLSRIPIWDLSNPKRDSDQSTHTSTCTRSAGQYLEYTETAPTHLCLQQGVGQLGVVQEQLPGLLRVVLDAPLHLLHQLKHLLGGQASDSLGDGLWGCLGRYTRSMEGGLLCACKFNSKLQQELIRAA